MALDYSLRVSTDRAYRAPLPVVRGAQRSAGRDARPPQSRSTRKALSVDEPSPSSDGRRMAVPATASARACLSCAREGYAEPGRPHAHIQFDRLSAEWTSGVLLVWPKLASTIARLDQPLDVEFL